MAIMPLNLTGGSTLQWSAGRGLLRPASSLALFIVVRYRILSPATTEWRTLRVGGLSAEVTSLTLHQLRPETDYEFTVLARNRLGDGLFTEITRARTKGKF